LKKPKLLLAALILLIGAASATASRLPNYNGDKAWPQLTHLR
jgi:hypothetical protein